MERCHQGMAEPQQRAQSGLTREACPEDTAEAMSLWVDVDESVEAPKNKAKASAPEQTLADQISSLGSMIYGKAKQPGRLQGKNHAFAVQAVQGGNAPSRNCKDAPSNYAHGQPAASAEE
eukprot:CAMPEP_0171086970 /NCGR_PEP_ID=MMETSP0766_2-20121228/19866_1 /TAXON_ID=439317 /ORGANISM="Gambierdiscus australes, Strain CAWD 149" /LENGTH=119 /DNA_ID=CAMNT_0011544645 /DNA_START=60 /DNA_END=419 /DNA_ORIENTATION=-